MIGRSLSPLALICFGLVSCVGETVCQRAAALDCDEPPPDLDQCEENLANNCSPDDIDHLDAYLDCMDDGDLACVTDPTPDQAAALELCVAELNEVSDECQVAESTAAAST